MYHGTAVAERFELEGSGTPDGPAWFSDSAYVAGYFSNWRKGPSPRVLEYRVVQAPNLFKWNEIRLDHWAEEHHGVPRRDLDIDEIVSLVCAEGYDGWIIPDNYPEGADIVICEPERFLELVDGEVQKNPEFARRGKRVVGEIVGWPDGNWHYDEHVDFGVLAAGGWTINFGQHLEPIGSVEGATEFHRGLRTALHEIVAAYPELIGFMLSFDGPLRAVRDLLVEPVPALREIVLMHGTSSALLPLIERDGLRPRGDTGSAAAFGRASSAAKGRSDAVYLTTQEGMARHAAHDAVNQFGGEPVMVRVAGLDVRRMAPDEDSRRTTAEESLAVLGSVAYVGTIPPSKFVGVVRLNRR